VTKWEYMKLHNSDLHTINRAGARGWELISVAFDGAYGWHYFKRPMEDNNGKEETEIEEAQGQENEEDQGEQEVYAQAREIFWDGSYWTREDL